MCWKMFIKKSLANLFSFKTLILGSRKGLRILMYHSISDGVVDDPKNIFTVDPKLFANHMELLHKDKGIEIVDLSQGLKEFDKNKLKVAVTFDDGFADTLYNVCPIMSSYKIPFSVFVVSDFVRKGIKNYLNQSELLELSNMKGVTIGSHGLTHTPFTLLSSNDLKNELDSSRKYLEDCIGEEVRSISYPHGKVNNKVINSVKNAGFLMGGTSQFNINRYVNNPLKLKRNMISSFDSREVFMQKVYGSWDWYNLYSKF